MERGQNNPGTLTIHFALWLIHDSSRTSRLVLARFARRRGSNVCCRNSGLIRRRELTSQATRQTLNIHGSAHWINELIERV